jgi:hypothetical protein
MVNQTAQSLFADYADIGFALDTELRRNFSPKREQPSSARFATTARYSRKRNPGAPTGPRRRLRK